MASDALVVENRRAWVASCGAPLVPRLDCAGRCRQLGEEGGDFYSVAPLENGRVTLAVGDASGKGLAAAPFIANVRTALRAEALFSEHDLTATLAAVNKRVHSPSHMGRYATLFYALVDAPRRTLRYVNAGHNPPMILHRNGSMNFLETGGAPVGMFPDWRFEEGMVSLQPGDVLIAYTDGVIEAENSQAEMWGVEGLRRIAGQNRDRNADEMVDAIFRAMDEFSRDRQSDDATVAVLRIN